MRSEEKIQKRGENTEAAILEAAEKLFMEQGFASTTTMQIAKRAGCNQALVHYYFSTKDNLFEKIFEEKVRFIVTNFLNINSEAQTLEDKIRKMVDVHFEFFRSNPRLVPFVLTEVLSDMERFGFMFDKIKQQASLVFAKIDETLRAEIEKGTIRPITTLNLVLTIVSLDIAPFIIGPILQKSLNLTDEQVDEHLDIRKKEVVDIVLRQIRK